jgi:hypothetical protein
MLHRDVYNWKVTHSRGSNLFAQCNSRLKRSYLGWNLLQGVPYFEIGVPDTASFLYHSPSVPLFRTVSHIGASFHESTRVPSG